MHIPILGIVGARLNSSRLPRKHLLDLAGRPMIARIFSRLEQVAELDGLVLATTDDSYNHDLVNWAKATGRKAFAYNGDVNDLVGRVDALVQRHNPQLVVYICGDCPLVDPQAVSQLIRLHEQNPQADRAWFHEPNGKPFIHEGIEIYARPCWNQLVQLSDTAVYREHVGSSLRDRHIPLHWVWGEPQPFWSAIKHRISVDTPSDYIFMQTLYQRWHSLQDQDCILPLKWAIEQILGDAELRAINQHVMQKTIHRRYRKSLIVTSNEETALCRANALARYLQDRFAAGTRLWILRAPDRPLDPWYGKVLAPYQFVPHNEKELAAMLRIEQIGQAFDNVIVDLADRPELNRLWGDASLLPLPSLAVNGCIPDTTTLALHEFRPGSWVEALNPNKESALLLEQFCASLPLP